MGLKNDNEKPHLYLLQVRLNYNKHAAAIDALLLLIEQTTESTPEGVDPARAVILELIDVYNGAERRAVIGSPIDEFENRLNSKLTLMLGAIDDGFRDVLSAIDVIEVVTPNDSGELEIAEPSQILGNIMGGLITDLNDRTGERDG